MHSGHSSQSDSPESNALPESSDGEGSGAMKGNAAGTVDRKNKKKQAEIETIAQLIESICKKKSGALRLSPKVQQRLASGPRPDGQAVEQFLLLARDDRELAVPRALLSTSRAFGGHPTVRGLLRDLARQCLLQHPLFQSEELAAAIQNTPESPSVADGLGAVMKRSAEARQKSGKRGADKKKQRERIKAAQALAVWFAESRGLSLGNLSNALYQEVWKPAALSITDDSARLEVLTKGEDVAALGLACGTFHARAVEADRRSEFAEERLAEALSGVEELRRELETLAGEMEELKVAMARMQDEHGEAVRSHRSELAHLRATSEGQRTRVLRRLKDDKSLLEEALVALRSDPPKIRVMEDHAERVIESQRGEIKKLESER